MPYLFALIFLCWFLTWFFVFRRGKRGTLQNLRDAQAEMAAATTPEEKRAAAKKVLSVIDDEDLAGVVVDDARASAERILRYS